MKVSRGGRYKIHYGRIILVLLVISIAFGFLFDFACTRIEYAIYEKPAKYQGFVSEYSEEFGVPENLIYAVMKTESGFNAAAESSAGAIGLMQIMPDTYLWLRDKLGEKFVAGVLYEPNTNIKYGTYYLSLLYDIYGNWDTALAAYNAGPGNVDKWLEDPQYAGDEKNVLKDIPFKETKNYIKKVNKALEKYNELYNEK